MGGVGPTQLLVVLGVLVLLFGAKKLPDAARAIGRSTRILRAELQPGTRRDAGREEQEGQVSG